MTHPLDGPRAKLDRADEHLEACKTEVATFLQGNPYEVVSKLEREAGRVRLILRIYRDPPLRIATIAGDCIHNLRSALDHLIAALVSEVGATPTDKEWRGIRFPVFESRRAWKDGHARHVKWLTGPMIAEIEAFQPYHGWDGSGPSWHPLLRLDTLWNWDKHQLLLPAIGSFEGMGEIGYQPNQDFGLVAKKWRLPWDVDVQDGTELAGVEFLNKPLPDDAEVEVYGGLTFDVAFHNGPAVTEELSELRAFVREDVLPRFRQFF